MRLSRSIAALGLILALLLGVVLASGTAEASAASEVNRALAAHREGEVKEAMTLYTRAIDSGELPLASLAMAYNNRAALWADLGHLKKAVEDYTLALELDSTNPMYYTNRGLTHQRWGQYQKALDDYSRALEVDDGYLDAMQAKAWLLATCPVAKLRNGPEAVELAGRAVSIARDEYTLDTLAAALAEDKKFTAAVRIQQQALSLLRGPGREEDAEAPKGMQQRLKLYAAKKPYREPPPRPPQPVKL